MKQISVILTFILISVSLMAQPPAGGQRGAGRPQGGPGERPPRSSNDRQQGAMILGIPDIAGLTLEQREKLSKEITNEHQSRAKLIQKKEELVIDTKNPGMAEKERQKLFSKIEEYDKKIKKNEEKYDKKYKKILTEEQYNTFVANKEHIKFDQRERGSKPMPKYQDEPSDRDMIDADRF